MHADGIYKEKEYTDKASFDVQHLLVDSSAKNEYSIQLQKGEKVANGFYVKKFPVWFSFRGNNGVILSAAKSAGILGNLLNKKELINVARGQLQWIIGQNPFDQSMMYGEGYRYAQQYSVSSGEIVGEIPVGIETNENTDVPYWPFFNNATYKEVWIGNVGKWLSVIAEVIKYK
ncbi:glycoside hydrolase family 9 protein [Pediococcus pentosaceus]